MLERKVIKDFNDKENKLKKYTAGKDIFRAEEKRYNELKAKGYVGEGKKVEAEKEKAENK